MPVFVLWVVAVIAAVVAASLMVALWCRRRKGGRGWTAQDYLTAISIAVSLFLGILSAMAARNDDPHEPREVTAYRAHVRAACTTLDANASPFIPDLADDGRNIQRDRLMEALNGTIDTEMGILNGLWAEPVPHQLETDVAEAKQTGDVWLSAERAAVDSIPAELPKCISIDNASLYVARLNQANNPNVSQFLGAMSNLAGQSCAT